MLPTLQLIFFWKK